MRRHSRFRLRYAAIAVGLSALQSCAAIDSAPQVPSAGEKTWASDPVHENQMQHPERIAPAALGVPLAPLHREYSQSILVAGRPVPLPDGQWYAVARGVSRGFGTDLYEHVALLRQSGNRVSGFLAIVANPRGKPAPPYPSFRACSRRSGLYQDIRAARAPEAQDCLYITMIRSAALRSAPRSPRLREVVGEADRRGLVVPETLAFVYLVIADANHSLVALLYLNPDLAGVPPAPLIADPLNAWAPSSLKHDPARTAYIQRLKDWAERWHNVLKVSFDGRDGHLPPDATP